MTYDYAMVTRFGMMLPGAVSLGAYEGGALAAILKAVQASDGQLVIDAIASASAGSVTGLVASRAILCGDDPIELMRSTWVDLPSLKTLEEGPGPDAPLSMKGLISTAQEILGRPIDPASHQNAQKVQVELSMALTALGGLTYSLVQQRPSANGDVLEPLQATTYVDVYRATLGPTSTVDDFSSHIEGALASGSTPVGFPPRRLDRTKQLDGYKANGIATPPEGPFQLWYSDGGDLDNQPLGRLLDLIGQIDNSTGSPPDWDRAIVLLNIEPGGPPTFSGTWFDPEMPTWLSTLLHVNHIRSTQSLYDDLRAVEKTNERIRWIKEVAAALDGKADDVIPALAQSIASRRTEIAAKVHTYTSATTYPVTPATTIEDLLRQAAGLEDKNEIPVHVISPEIDPSVTLTVDRQLAGEFLFHFGGFFDVKFRESDFSLGYRNAQYWLQRWLPARIPDSAPIMAAVNDGLKDLPWDPIDEGQASVSSLSLSEKLRGLKLLGHIQHVVGHDLDRDLLHAHEAGTGDHPHASIRDLIEQRVKSVVHGPPHQP
jgi:hypothetical protein